MSAAPAKILVVDDEPDLEALILQTFRRRIREGTVRFLFARDGVEALDLLTEHRDVDLVVSDINMPRMDGLSLLAKLQEADEKLSTVIVSAYGDMANIRVAMNRGAFDFLTKPIDFADFETTVDRTVLHVRALREARRRQAEAERAHATLSRYFSPNLAERLAADASSLAAGGHRRDVASLFTDVAGFTTLVESLDPALMAELLNGYLATMTGLVFRYEGTVAKIVGDAIHVLFGAPGEQPDHASRAVACALALDEAAQALRAAWAERGVSLGATRIGVHAGPAIVGNFGGDRFFDYTAYGDTINIAARLEAANKVLGTRICVSAAVAERAEAFRGRPIGDLLLRGKSAPLRAYEPLSEAAYADPATARYAQAFAKLAAQDPCATQAFAALIGQRPDDRLASFHLRRLLNGETGTRIDLGGA
ncbi:adenylate/guanylate cyclase [Methylobacterium sp. 4-46]|uniref:adenylate/guanylate cyclase domain-containing protein n=1 Tax=unclassified Methylobacterium TaxID=2615210 RepID=UPI000152DB22|nr:MULTISPECIES: adenylate/guanylate cyclase domain-containing protein [Methylobacterium]ACA19616.1 adenylate/guanylate cyclase [Methylobacterium sp. 4-46]WFT78810.1 adenylate/guanylate cyclase domain-containing protein [Methylobacterium nodulans]